MYSLLARHVLYPIGEAFLGANMLRYLEMLEETQWWSSVRLRELQDQKLRALIRHAYWKVPYYRRIFEERGLTAEDVQIVEDLHKLPILTKDDIRQNSSELIAEDFKKWKPILSVTSGSTGEPLRYYTTKDVASMAWAGMFRSWAWAGHRLGDKRVTFAGSALVPSHNNNTALTSRLRNLIERNLALSPSGVTDETMGRYVEKIRKFKPKYIRGFPSAIYVLAEYVAKKGIEDISPRAIFSTGETLLPSQRDALERVFRCEVFDHYGLYDGGAMIMECPTHEGYHVVVEKAIIEIVNQGRTVPPGEQGEIITTDLHNYAMPFIRYATGDLATSPNEKCSCGRGLPLVKTIEGRKIDLIVLDSDHAISGLVLTDVLEYIAHQRPGAVKQFQVIQEAIGQIVIKVVQGPDYSAGDTDIIVSETRKRVGNSWSVEVQFVDDIPITPAGKRLFVISKVSV